MIDLNLLRQDPQIFIQACAKKHIKFDVDAFLELDNKYRQLKSRVEELRAEQNIVSKSIPKLVGEKKEKELARMKELSANLKEQDGELKTLELLWKREQLRIPSPPSNEVPDGKDDSENKELRKWGEIPEFSFKIKDHVELGKALDIIDIERGVKVAGARNYFLKGDGARLQHAILSLAMDFVRERGYTVMDCPHIVHYDAMMGTSYFPGGEDQAYHLDERDEDFYLIGTSEVAVCSYHKDEILNKDNLPIRYAGYSPCYRREAGSYGRDTHGLYRIHQFYKVEQVVMCEADPEKSKEMHAELLKNAEDLMQLMNVPYRVVVNCSGDLGQGQIIKNDIEAWMPSRNGYGETHSCSTFHDFQSRRLKIRYKNSEGKNVYCHTLNNTLIASPRALIPVLENNQTEDGEIIIPECLRKYMGGQERISLPL